MAWPTADRCSASARSGSKGWSATSESDVRNLTTFKRGERYSEKALLDTQERLQRSGLFEGAVVSIEPDPALAEAVPVTARVREAPLQQATVGIGYADQTGERITLEHTHRRVFNRLFFGTQWIAKNKIELGRVNQSWQGDLSSHPLAGRLAQPDRRRPAQRGDRRHPAAGGAAAHRPGGRDRAHRPPGLRRGAAGQHHHRRRRGAQPRRVRQLPLDLAQPRRQPAADPGLGGQRRDRASAMPGPIAADERQLRPAQGPRHRLPAARRQLVRQRPARTRAGLRRRRGRHPRHPAVPRRWRRFGARLCLPQPRSAVSTARSPAAGC